VVKSIISRLFDTKDLVINHKPNILITYIFGTDTYYIYFASIKPSFGGNEWAYDPFYAARQLYRFGMLHFGAVCHQITKCGFR
jgi:hypothetical protein